MHFVNSRLDSGKIILQKKVRINKKDNEIRALRNQRDNLQLEIKTMKLYELAVIRKLLVDKEITFPTKSTPNGFRDSLRNLVKVEYYEDDAPHQFPTNSTETLKKYETS